MDAKIFKTLHVKAVQRDIIIAPQIKNNSTIQSGQRDGIWAKHSPRDSKLALELDLI